MKVPNMIHAFTLGDRVCVYCSDSKKNGEIGTIVEAYRGCNYGVSIDGDERFIYDFSPDDLEKVGHTGKPLGIPRYAIYGLSDPQDSAIRYVGYSSNLKQRYQAHYSTSEANCNMWWIKGLKKQGLRPLLSTIDYAYTLRDASNCEMYWIYQLAFNGVDLLNREVERITPQDLCRLLSIYAAARQARIEC